MTLHRSGSWHFTKINKRSLRIAQTVCTSLYRLRIQSTEYRIFLNYSLKRCGQAQTEVVHGNRDCILEIDTELQLTTSIRCSKASRVAWLSRQPHESHRFLPTSSDVEFMSFTFTDNSPSSEALCPRIMIRNAIHRFSSRMYRGMYSGYHISC